MVFDQIGNGSENSRVSVSLNWLTNAGLSVCYIDQLEYAPDEELWVRVNLQG